MLQVFGVAIVAICFMISTNARPGTTHERSEHKHEIKWIDCAQNIPLSTVDTGGSFNTSSIDLTNLPSELRCGQLDVLMDYSKPFCNENKITLGLATYLPKHSKGPLFFCPGGTDPGVVTIWEVALNLTNAFSGLLDFQIIAIDIRGTYSSNPLNVSLDIIEAVLQIVYPTSESEYEAMVATSAASFKSWSENSTPKGILGHVGTFEVSRDYEMLRKAFGFEKINFLGASDGSFRAQQYANDHPKRVGLFVLDAVIPHGRSYFDQANDDIKAQNRIMQRADAYCLNDISCPFYGQGKGSVIKAFKTLVASLEPDVSFEVRTALSQAVAGLPDFPNILEAIYAGVNGDLSLFGVDDPNTLTTQEFLEIAWGQPLTCPDDAFPHTFEYLNHSLEVGLAQDITGIGLAAAWFTMVICSGWPFPYHESISSPLHIEVPMLLVTADFDASAITEWTTFAWEQIPNAVLVDRHGEDHVSFLLVDQASTKITKDYLNTGKLPLAQNSTFVTVYTPGMKRGPVVDPYLVPTGAQAGDVHSGEVVEEQF